MERSFWPGRNSVADLMAASATFAETQLICQEMGRFQGKSAGPRRPPLWPLSDPA
jgi:hypothetical protein